MIKFTEWLKIREMVGTGAIYPKTGPEKLRKAYDKNRDWNWWGAPESEGMTQDQAQKHMRKQIKK